MPSLRREGLRSGSHEKNRSTFAGSCQSPCLLAAIARTRVRFPLSTVCSNSLPSQVWGELTFPVSEKDLGKTKQFVEHEMKGVGEQRSLSMQLNVDLGTGHNWRVMHP